MDWKELISQEVERIENHYKQVEEKMKLSEMKFKDIKPGLEVISAIGTPGKITECIEEVRGGSVRYDTLSMDWENGKSSTVFHMNADKVTVKE